MVQVSFVMFSLWVGNNIRNKIDFQWKKNVFQNKKNQPHYDRTDKKQLTEGWLENKGTPRNGPDVHQGHSEARDDSWRSGPGLTEMAPCWEASQVNSLPGRFPEDGSLLQDRENILAHRVCADPGLWSSGGQDYRHPTIARASIKKQKQNILV